MSVKRDNHHSKNQNFIETALNIILNITFQGNLLRVILHRVSMFSTGISVTRKARDMVKCGKICEFYEKRF